MAIKLAITANQVSELKKSISKHLKKPGALMPILHDAQEIFGCVPIEVQKIISEETNIPISKINGVVTFYSRFSIEPKGKHIIAVCMGTACYVRGAQNVLDAFEKALGIRAGETTEDGMFTLEATRCIGACGLAPVFSIDGKVYGGATPAIANEVLKELMENKD